MSRQSRKGAEGSAGKIATAPLIGTAVANSPGMDQLPSASVSFTSPVYLGKRDEENPANQITYIATSNPGNITATSTSSPILVSGLTPGITYTFTVRATNTLGDSPASGPSNQITTVSAPPVFIFVPPVFTPPNFPPVFTPPVFTPPNFPPVFTPPVFTPPMFPPVFTPPNFPPAFFVPPPMFSVPPPAFFVPPPMFSVPPPMFTAPPPPMFFR